MANSRTTIINIIPSLFWPVKISVEVSVFVLLHYFRNRTWISTQNKSRPVVGWLPTWVCTYISLSCLQCLGFSHNIVKPMVVERNHQCLMRSSPHLAVIPRWCVVFPRRCISCASYGGSRVRLTRRIVHFLRPCFSPWSVYSNHYLAGIPNLAFYPILSHFLWNETD